MTPSSPSVDLDSYYSSLNKNGDSQGSDASPSSASPPVNSQSSFLGKRERETEVEDERLLKVQKTSSSGDETINPLVYGKSLRFQNTRSSTNINHFLVAGEAKRFLEITEAEQDLMTPEEYEAYAELMVQLS